MAWQSMMRVAQNRCRDGQPLRGANMMIAMPASATNEPTRSHVVGLMPSTLHSPVSPRRYKRRRTPHRPDRPQSDGATTAMRTTPGSMPPAPAATRSCLAEARDTEDSSRRFQQWLLRQRGKSFSVRTWRRAKESEASKITVAARIVSGVLFNVLVAVRQWATA